MIKRGLSQLGNYLNVLPIVIQGQLLIIPSICEANESHSMRSIREKWIVEKEAGSKNCENSVQIHLKYKQTKKEQSYSHPSPILDRA